MANTSSRAYPLELLATVNSILLLGMAMLSQFNPL